MDTSDSAPHSVVSPSSRCSVAICAVKQAIASDLDTQYQDPDVCIYADEHVYTNGPTSEMSGSPDRRTRSNCQQLSA